jgi:hypothetical protein
LPRYARNDGERFGGQIPIQDNPVSGETQRSTKLGSDPQTVISAEHTRGPLNGGQSPISFFAFLRRKQSCPELGSDPHSALSPYSLKPTSPTPPVSAQSAGLGIAGWALIGERLGGQIPIQDSPISGETHRRTKLGSDPQTVISGERPLLCGPPKESVRPTNSNSQPHPGQTALARFASAHHGSRR